MIADDLPNPAPGARLRWMMAGQPRQSGVVVGRPLVCKAVKKLGLTVCRLSEG